MRYTFVIALLCLFVACCTPKHYQGRTYASTLDYLNEYSQFIVDTTFTYELLSPSKNKIKNDVKLPDSLGGNKMSGKIDFYCLIDQDKNIKGIEFINVELFKRQKLYFSFDRGETKTGSDSYNKKLKQYVLEEVKSYPFKTHLVPSNDLHKTYCFITVQ
jgi:hypothetical protein